MPLLPLERRFVSDNYLSDDVGDEYLYGDALANEETDGHSRVEVSTRNVGQDVPAFLCTNIEKSPVEYIGYIYIVERQHIGNLR